MRGCHIPRAEVLECGGNRISPLRFATVLQTEKQKRRFENQTGVCF
jgi:hypothetical protein